MTHNPDSRCPPPREYPRMTAAPPPPRSPSGMIESTPQLFGNAWRVSSACVSSLMAPQLDPCDTHQQAGQCASQNAEKSIRRSCSRSSA